jgi:acyl-CoA hydrolase
MSVLILTEANLIAVLERLPGRPRVVASGNYATPMHVLELLDKSVESYRLFILNAQYVVAERDGVEFETPFVGPAMRHAKNLHYFPCRLSLVPHLLATTMPPDVVLVHTTTPRGGTVSLGVEVNVLPGAIEAARARGALVIAQMNPQMPYTHGDAVVTLDRIDYGYEVDAALSSPAPRQLDSTAESIGQQVARLVADGSTLQLGIGAVPDAALAALLDHRGLRVWSEMFSDGVLALERAGAMNQDEPITASFLFGTPELYAWSNDNPRIRLLRTEKTNDPGRIARQPAMTSVNTALQVDLYGQANASRTHGAIYSGFGGQTDFVVGALHSTNGKAIIALPSWHAKSDTSTVVPILVGPVTSFQHSYVISEHGAAAIWGYDAATQARHIIDNVAHPRARDQLRAAAAELGIC